MSFYKDNSPFWRYFKDKLAFGLVTAPGALAVLTHGLARYLDDVRADIYWLREQFAPPTAEDAHISLHGQSRGVPRTRFDDAARYRRRVERAHAWHRLGGKAQGLPQILSEYGFSGGTVYNLRQTNPDLWAHFGLDLLHPPRDFSAADVEAVLALANQYKPGRSVIGLIRFAAQQRAPLCLGAAAQTTVVLDSFITAKVAAPPEPARLRLGVVSNVFVAVQHKAGQI